MMKAVSLFSGCGGLDQGFQQAGFRIVRAVDNDPAAVAVHNANLGQHCMLADVTHIDFREWSAELGPIQVILGGFPCQGFSKAGTKRLDDPRNLLYLAMRAAVRAIQPLYFVAENVEGLAQNFRGQVLELISQDFADIGYSVSVALLDAVAYGVPQHRRRLVFVGVRRGKQPLPFSYPHPTHFLPVRNGETRRPKAMSSSIHGLSLSILGSLPPPLSMADSIGDLLDLRPQIPDHQIYTRWPGHYKHVMAAISEGQKLCNVRHGPESVRTWDIPAVFGQTTSQERCVLETIARNRRHKQYGNIPNGNPLPVRTIEHLSGQQALQPVLESLAERGFLKRKGSGYDLLGALFCSGLFKRPRWDEPAPTVLTNFGNPRYFFHPRMQRPFSLREAARLQGFPDSFGFLKAGISLLDGFRLIGNAVPPPLARSIAEALLQHHSQVAKVSA